MEALWVKDPEQRILLLKMAALYDRLAAHAEKIRRSAKKP